MKTERRIFILFFIAFLVAYATPLFAQSISTKSERMNYLIRTCSFSVDLLKNSGIDEHAGRGEEYSRWDVYYNYYYHYPLGYTSFTEDGISIDSISMELICANGETQDMIDYYNGGHWHNGMWVFDRNNKPWPPEYEARQTNLVGENWKGIIAVRNAQIQNNVTVDRYYFFCIHQNDASQSLCGQGMISLDGDTELNKIVEAIGAIKFVSIKGRQFPSFDCAKATIFTEKTICADAKLSLLDATLVSNYKRLKHADLGLVANKKLPVEQQEWIKQRNNCKNIECLLRFYTQRIQELCENYGVVSGGQPSCITISEALANAEYKKEKP
jgi:uncharacterized protein YecT (DUF1311 family)